MRSQQNKTMKKTMNKIRMNFNMINRSKILIIRSKINSLINQMSIK